MRIVGATVAGLLGLLFLGGCPRNWTETLLQPDVIYVAPRQVTRCWDEPRYATRRAPLPNERVEQVGPAEWMLCTTTVEWGEQCRQLSAAEWVEWRAARTTHVQVGTVRRCAAEEAPPAQVYGGQPSYGGGGRVHVRGYHRRDGTYVRPHSRSRPRRR